MKGYAGVVLLVSAVVVGCGGSSGPTRGSQCRELMQVFCSRAANDCQLIPTDQIAACVSSGVTSCCGGPCGRSVVSTQADIDVCATDLNAASCATLDVANGGALPSSCEGVVRSALTTNSSSLLSGAGSTPERAGRMISN